MKKGLLNEIKAMNKTAGTQLTKEQEIKLIKERLKQLNEVKNTVVGGEGVTYPKVIKGTYTLQLTSERSQRYTIKFGNDKVDTDMTGGVFNGKFGWFGSGGCTCDDFFDAIVKDINKSNKFK
jgi:hypothetical protein